MNTTRAEVVHLYILVCLVIFEVYVAIVVGLRSGDVSSVQRSPRSWKGVVGNDQGIACLALLEIREEFVFSSLPFRSKKDPFLLTERWQRKSSLSSPAWWSSVEKETPQFDSWSLWPTHNYSSTGIHRPKLLKQRCL